MIAPGTRIAVVTGAGSGIGAATALALAADGWTVVLTGRRRQALDQVAQDGAGQPGTLDPAPADVSDEDSVRGLFDGVVDRYGRVDLLVNNAGVGAPQRDFDEVPLSEWQAGGAGEPPGGFLLF